MRGTNTATTSELCKLLVFITSRESDLWNPGAKVITDTVHFGFNLNGGGGGGEGKYHNTENNSSQTIL